MIGGLRKKSPFIWALYFLGVVHWVVFFFAVYPPEGDWWLLDPGNPPEVLFDYPEYTAHDYMYREVNYLSVLQQSLTDGVLPFHTPQLGVLVQAENDRFLGVPIWSMSPQVIFLYVLDPFFFSILNQILMYSLGFMGCLLLRRFYSLDLISFSFLFLVFNFNGYFVAKIPAYGPSQLGYFLMPMFVLFLLRSSDRQTNTFRERIFGAVTLGCVMAAIFFQGSLHLFVACVTFVSIWGVCNYREWPVSITALMVTFALSAVRILPAAVTFGSAGNVHGLVGYGRPEFLLDAFVVAHDQFWNLPFTWWEFDVYISIFGLLGLIYFGLWGPLLETSWACFKPWSPLLLPLGLVSLLCIRDLKRFIVPEFIPLLNAESLTTRYIVIPLLIVLVIASVNFGGFVRRYAHSRRIRYVLVSSMMLLGLMLFNHSREWRIQKIQAEVNAYEAATGTAALHEAINIPLKIQNDPTDRTYIWAFWLGLLISISSLAGLTRLWGKNRESAALWWSRRFEPMGEPISS